MYEQHQQVVSRAEPGPEHLERKIEHGRDIRHARLLQERAELSESKPLSTGRLLDTLREEQEEVVNTKKMTNAQANNPDMSSSYIFHDDDVLDWNQLASQAYSPVRSIFNTAVEAWDALTSVPKAASKSHVIIHVALKFVVLLAVAT